jgi:hypothetical protein
MALNLSNYVQARQSPGGYLVPTIGAVQSQSDLSLNANQTYLVNQNLPANDEHWAMHIGKAVVSGPTDIIDSVAALFPGLERGDTNDAFWNTIGMPGHAAWVRDNHGSVEVASGLMGAVTIGLAAEMAAVKVATSGWFAATGLGRAAQPLLQWTANAKHTASAATLAAAAQGQTLGAMQGANLALIGAKATELAAKTAVAEAAIVATLNQNSMIWGDDLTQNLLFAGLGVGIGGALGAIQGRAMVNRWANSPQVKMEHALYSDPRGFAKGQNEALREALDRGMSGEHRVKPKLSTQIVSSAMIARDEITGGTRETIKTGAQEDVERLTTTWGRFGNWGLNGSAIQGNSLEGLAIREAAFNDPAIFWGASSIGRLDPSKPFATVMRDRNAAIQAHVTPTPNRRVTHVEQEQAAVLRRETPVVMVNGALATPQEVPHLISFPGGQTQFQRAVGGISLSFDSPSVGRTFINEDGSINKSYDALNLHDRLRVAEGQERMMETMLKLQMPIKLSAKAHWNQIDMAVAYSRRGGVVDFANLGVNSVEELEVKSLAMKSDLMQPLATLSFEDRIRFNLPLATAYERIADANGAMLKQLALAAKNPGVTIADLKQMRLNMIKSADLLSDAKITDTLDGDIFRFNRGKTGVGKGKWMPPLLAFYETPAINTWTKFNLADDAAETMASRLLGLRDQTDAPLVKLLTETITANPTLYRLITNVAELANDQISGTGSGLAMNVTQFLTKNQQFRNSEMLLAVQGLRRVVNRIVENQIDEAIRPVTPLIDKISSTAGAKSRVLLNQYGSWANGWDIARAEQGVDGFWRFILRTDSIHNSARLGRPVQRDEVLTLANGNDLVLDDLANDMRIATESITKKLGVEANRLRVSKGYEPLHIRDFYVPPSATTNKYVGYTFDASNRTVPGGGIVADSAEEFNRLRAEHEATLPAGQRFYTMDEVRRNVDLWEQAGMDFIDPTYMMKRNVASRGALSSTRINPHYLEDTIAYIKHGYEQIGNGLVRTVFDPQLRTARILAATRPASLKSGKTTTAASQPKNVFEIYHDTMMGVSSSSDPRGLNSMAQGLDDSIDRAAEAIWPGVVWPAKNWMRDVLAKIGQNKIGPVKSFDDLANELGPHMPFATVAKHLEYVNGIKAPWQSKEMARHANRFGAGVILRWLELPHALMNVAGVITNMPAIIGANHVPLAGRINGLGIPDTMKIMAKGMKRLHSADPTARADRAYAEKMGDLTQDIAELYHQTSLMHGKSGWMRVMTGDPSMADWKNYTGADRRKRFLRYKGIEGLASIATDSSENWSKSVSHFIGLQLADHHGITGMAERHTFAREIANNAIANYDPLNRPEIYHSAFGTMYGLFLSYAQNFMERMFRYMEGAEYKAIGRNAAVQASLFGFTGLPGTQALAALIGGQEEGDGLLDGIYERFGASAGAVIAHGSFNQITTILGQPAMSIHARGDLNFRHPSFDFITSGQLPIPVGISVMADLWQGATETISKLIDPKVPMTSRYAVEIMARHMPSRMLRGTMVVLGSGGQEADAYGNVMAETKSFAESAFRMLGVRSQRQGAEIEAYFMNQQARDIDASRRAELREATRALVRSGNFRDQLPKVFERYLESGGSPWAYPQWLQDTIQDARRTRTENQLLDTLRSPTQRDLARRIQLYTGEY